MKNKNWLICMIVFGCVLFFPSCRDIRTTTRIFPDGSCERRVVVEGDSTGNSGLPFPVPCDSTWSITYDKESDPKLYTAVKRFPDVKSLNREYIQDSDTVLAVRISQQLKKKFRWFNTYFHYEEIYYATDPFKTVPITDYLTREELEAYYINNDTLDIEKRMEGFWEKAIFESFYQDLTGSILAQGRSEEILTTLAVHKDSLISLFRLDNMSEDTMIISMKALLGDRMDDRVTADVRSAFRNIDRKIEFLMEADIDYQNEVIMPGLILDTNAKDVEGNSVRWKFDDNRLSWEDYRMWAESRVVNRWAMIVTGILCVLMVAGLLFGSLLKQKRKKEGV